jgi:hypothetical protein
MARLASADRGEWAGKLALVGGEIGHVLEAADLVEPATGPFCSKSAKLGAGLALLSGR